MRLINRVEKLEKRKGAVKLFWCEIDESVGEMLKRYAMQKLADDAMVITWAS